LDTGASNETFNVVDSFAWPKDLVSIRHRTKNAGIFYAVTEGWYPSSDHEYGLMLEDDIEVSSSYYAWAKYSILKYRYSDTIYNNTSQLFGISLYSPRFAEITSKKRPFLVEELGVPIGTPYLFQLPCSWGAVYFPEHWRKFHSFLEKRPPTLTYIPKIRSNTWSKSWKKYFIELVFIEGLVMLYPNFGDGLSFSTNRVERGEHFHTVSATMKERYMMPLFKEDDFVFKLANHSLPEWDSLPLFNVYHERDILANITDMGLSFQRKEGIDGLLKVSPKKT
jgi:hypothetical protein